MGPVLTHEDIACMRKHFHIPAGVTLRIPSPEDKPYSPNPGEVCLNPIAFKYGLRLPFHPFIRTVLAHFGLAPSQVAPNVWRHMVGAIILWRVCSDDQDHITLDEFNYCYRFKSNTSFYFLCAREEGRCLVLGCQSSHPRWHETFFFASGSGWEFGPQEGTSPAPPVPTQWGLVDKDKKNKMSEPIPSDVYMSQVNRALAFNCKRRNYLNLITPENINKYLLNNVPTLLCPSFDNAAFRLDPRIFSESSTRAKGRKRRVSDTAIDSSSTKKLCADARRRLVKRSSSSTTQTDSAQPNPSSSEQPCGFPRLLEVESSSSESSVQIVDKEKKGHPLLHGDDLILERAKQLLTPDEMKQMEELGSNKALRKSISYAAKAVAMMIALCGQLGLENNQMSKHKETLAALQKTRNAYVDQLAATYVLSKDVEILKNKLAETEKSVNDRDETIHAKDEELRAREEEIRAKDEQIKALKEAASNAVKEFTESEMYENLMAQCYLKAYESFCSQASSVPPYADWSSLESISGCEEKPK